MNEVTCKPAVSRGRRQTFATIVWLATAANAFAGEICDTTVVGGGGPLPLPPVASATFGSLACGSNAHASATFGTSTALGLNSVASSADTTALGGESAATGVASAALGAESTASGNSSTAAGYASFAFGSHSTAVGTHSEAGVFAVALGAFSQAGGVQSTALGQSSVALGDSSVAAGAGAVAIGFGAIATGGMFDFDHDGTAVEPYEETIAVGEFSSAYGTGSLAEGDGSTAVGSRSGAYGSNSVALGQASIADRDHTVSVGSAGAERQIVNVADGTVATDVTNVRQMQTGDAATLTQANTYTDTHIAASEVATLTQANAYTDKRVSELVGLAGEFDSFARGVDARFGAQSDRIDRLGALSAAMMGMAASAAAVESGSTRIGFGIGSYNSKEAISIGVQKRFGNRAAFTLGGAVSGSERSGTLGVGIGF